MVWLICKAEVQNTFLAEIRFPFVFSCFSMCVSMEYLAPRLGNAMSFLPSLLERNETHIYYCIELVAADLAPHHGTEVVDTVTDVSHELEGYAIICTPPEIFLKHSSFAQVATTFDDVV